MKYWLLIGFLALQGCVPMMPMNTQSHQTQVEMLKLLQKINSQKTPPIFGDFSIDGSALATLPPGELVKVIEAMADVAKNMPKDTHQTDIATESEQESESTYSQKETLLMFGLGLLVVFMVVRMIWSSVKNTTAGRVAQAGFVGSLKFIESKMDEVDHKKQHATDPAEIAALDKELAALVRDQKEARRAMQNANG